MAGRDRGGTRCHDRLLVPLLKTRGFSSLPVHFLGKAATFSLLYAFPLVLLGSGEQGWLQLAWVLGWAFAIWGTALYWYAGGLYVAQTVKLAPHHPAHHRRRRGGVTGQRPERQDRRADDKPGDDTGMTSRPRRRTNAAVKRPARRPGLRRSRVAPAPDASMDLLNQIIRQPVDPGLRTGRRTSETSPPRTVDARGARDWSSARYSPWRRCRPLARRRHLQSERAELISRVQTAEREQDELRGRVTSLTQEIATLRAAALGDDDAARGRGESRSIHWIRWSAMSL